MKTTDYAGIDYGLGRSNIDNETGIHFGLLSQNTEGLNQNAVQDLFDGTNLSFEHFKNVVKDNLRNAVEDYFYGKEEIDSIVERLFDEISDDLNDKYQGDDDTYLYTKDGYVIQVSGGGDIWVLKSPFYTFTQFCSPCAPGAGNLNTLCGEENGGVKTYCLGADWFENETAPYSVFTVNN